MRDDYSLDPDTREEDKVFIQRYGFSYTRDARLTVAVPLRYLGYLSKEHQNYWTSYQLGEDIALDKDYFTQTFKGEWTDRVSPFEALLQELKEINVLCDMIGWPHLFRETPESTDVPTFGWMTKPTSYELESFVHTVDKLLSENLNHAFFAKEESEEEKGTISLLAGFLKKRVRLQEPGIIDELIGTFRDIRNRRQKPAHTITSDRYEGALLDEQCELMRKVYSAVRDIRLILMNHPAASGYEPPDWLQTGRIG